jgi:glycerate kinase
MVNLLKNKKLVNSSLKLSGAGGGLAAGFQIVFNSKLIEAEKFIMDELKLRREIQTSDYIITGEGRFDFQSSMGKGAGLVVQKSVKKNKYLFVICGKFAANKVSRFTVFELQKLFKSKKESIQKFEEGIGIVCKKIAKSIK